MLRVCVLDPGSKLHNVKIAFSKRAVESAPESIADCPFEIFIEFYLSVPYREVIR